VIEKRDAPMCGVKKSQGRRQVVVALAASSINALTSWGLDASDAWLALRVIIFLAPNRPDIRF
jgi:hypothetical protein